MSYKLQDKSIALLGGDDREVKLLSMLKETGAKLQVLGEVTKIEGIKVVNSLTEIDNKVDAVIAPMTGINQDYQIKKTFVDKDITLTEEFFAKLQPATKFFIGFAKPQLKKWCTKYDLELIELAALDEVAILNAVPTAEGAIELAIREASINLHNNNSFVLGLGRVGLTVARMLKGLGSNTFGVARKNKDLARALEMGLTPVNFKNLSSEINKADFIFNTVPVKVLDRKLLEQVNPNTLIIDLASAPGGTDFETAQQLGIQAELALGLPGKVAPTSAGEILGNVIPRFILEES
ncbi:prephenate dehydrogenase [Halobacteroides halobius DSM 5150]|uniref:Prephenate dehydrogenase n=1 Tax=Halobacteroides halobius (strain ATCC 35273 / DSM 5150 / MD-1) TaxID=748449 RepID=L0K9A2_HALHC|nr:dipicolinate synthase subunit DpsA [Halobacteroides halobius]AGB40693.1 prephenate dehydrogenase [Halobacteroides halobius DSM 5150]